MKTLKLLTAGMLAVASLHVASATTVKITGSSAYRKALYAAIVNKLGNGTVKVGYIGDSTKGLGSANQATFTNGTDTIQVCMAGSVGGVNWVINNINAATDKNGASSGVAWIADASTTWSTASVAGSAPYAVSGGVSIASNNAATLATGNSFEVAAPADVTMSDSAQDSTPFSFGRTGVRLTDSNSGVGVVPFVWCKGLEQPGLPAGSYSRLTNMSALAFQNLTSLGFAPLAMFTGDFAHDANIDVILVGRDNDSGTRLAAFAETKLGPVTTSQTDYQVFDSTGVIDRGITAGTIFSISAFADGSSGYSSGGQVKTALTDAIDSSARDDLGNPFILVGYLGIGDDAGAAQHLNHNGMAYSATALNYGQYTFWTIEHLFYKSSIVTAKKTIADAVAASIKGTYAPASGQLVGDLQVSRASEGAVVNPNY